MSYEEVSKQNAIRPISATWADSQLKYWHYILALTSINAIIPFKLILLHVTDHGGVTHGGSGAHPFPALLLAVGRHVGADEHVLSVQKM